MARIIQWKKYNHKRNLVASASLYVRRGDERLDLRAGPACATCVPRLSWKWDREREGQRRLGCSGSVCEWPAGWARGSSCKIRRVRRISRAKNQSTRRCISTGRASFLTGQLDAAATHPFSSFSLCAHIQIQIMQRCRFEFSGEEI